jgi:4-alpha-glucanotransferase
VGFAEVKPGTNPILDRRAFGVLAHISSLDGSCAIGDTGPSALAFIDWCAAAGAAWWQMLPVGPVGPGESPYSSTSSFAGEPLFISLEGLRDDGLIGARSLRDARRTAVRVGGRALRARGANARCSFDAARAAKEPAFLEAFEAFRLGRGFEGAAYRAFARRERAWLDGWLRYQGDRNGFHAFLQFQFDRQWNHLRTYATSRGVRLLGDVPIFISLDSADVASHPELFRLDSRGRPSVVTGVPPDCFSADGQLWGHPHYRWEAHRRQDFDWWCRRLGVALQRFDGVRIDHFVGFHHAYEIPAGARTARRGRWRPQPGKEVLSAARRTLGALPLIAEDLGAVTPEVVALRKEFQLPGMKVLQNAFGGSDSGELPHHHPVDSVVYTGTHDNETTVQWRGSRRADELARLRAVCGPDALRDPAQALIRMAFLSPAQLAVIPLQDVLGLGANARMNVPGVALGNWTWRVGADWGVVRRGCAERLRRLAEATGRMQSPPYSASVRRRT